MTRVWAILILLLICSLSFAQKKPAFFHSAHEIASKKLLRVNVATPRDSVRIIAIMVEFQKDADEQTTGDGSFQKEGSATQIDPPPHDSLYFKNKLRFVENYYRQVSNGILTITADLCSPLIITLSKPMSSYSPPINLDDKSKLVEFVEESWQRADTLYPGVDFSRYDAFVIFHAGAGRDIDLVSLLGINPTPYDIPSLFIDSASIAAVKASTLGIPIRDSTVYIKNSIILPETESRVISTGFGDETLQFSINGLFAACVGSYLGLPDLFDTKTGRSGIGQFGLMDGAGIFAYNGLFPPEPSAWEKVYLGWVNPITIQNSFNSISVPAVGLIRSGQDSIYKVSISGTEYFLLENRNRNPQLNGLDLDVVSSDGSTIRRHFNQDTVGFKWDWGAYDISGISGSVIDVSNFDWALVGETDGTGKYDGGGILIWHIDENVISSGFVTNSVNTNIDHRGVDLEEADGSQDIGQVFEFLSPGAWAAYGSPLDFWFNGNLSVIYKNIFDRTTLPNSISYTGASSLVTIKDFSARAPRMNVTVEIGNQTLLVRDSVLYHKLSTANTYPTSTGKSLFVPTKEGLYAFQSNGMSLTNDVNGLLPVAMNIGEVAVFEFPDSIFIAGVHGDTLEIVQLAHPDIYGKFDSVYVHGISINQRFSTSPCFLNDTILIGTDSGCVCKFNFKGDFISQHAFGNDQIVSITQLPGPTKYSCTSGNQIYDELHSNELPVTSNKWILSAAFSPGGSYIVAAERNGNRLVCFDEFLTKKLFDVVVSGSGLHEIAIGDLDKDGEKDIIVQSATHLSAYNRLGILLDGFPVQSKRDNEFTGAPLIIDCNNDEASEIVTFTTDGEMWIYNHGGELLTGYPVQVSSPGIIYPVIYTNSSNKIGIAVFSEADSMNAFLTSGMENGNSLIWWQHLCDEKHKNAEWIQTTFIPPVSEFLPKMRAYNWPNPVYGSSTHIRYYTSEDASITITILDLSGVKITELKGRGTGGMDNEIEWDVSNIQSGVYLARIEAHGSSRSDVVFIKMAIVK